MHGSAIPFAPHSKSGMRSALRLRLRHIANRALTPTAMTRFFAHGRSWVLLYFRISRRLADCRGMAKSISRSCRCSDAAGSDGWLRFCQDDGPRAGGVLRYGPWKDLPTSHPGRSSPPEKSERRRHVLRASLAGARTGKIEGGVSFSLPMGRRSAYE